MASILIYKVYIRKKGSQKKTMVAGFANRVDAVNYAHAESIGLYRRESNTILLIMNNRTNRKVFAYCQGELI